MRKTSTKDFIVIGTNEPLLPVKRNLGNYKTADPEVNARCISLGPAT